MSTRQEAIVTQFGSKISNMAICFTLLSSVVSYSHECRTTIKTDQTLQFQYEGWSRSKSFEDAPTAQYTVITDLNSKNLPSIFRKLPPDLLKSLEDFQKQGTPILLFSHDTIGGFVASSSEKFSVFVSQKLNRQNSVPLIALNTKALYAEVVAHELVHLHDEMSGTSNQIRLQFENALSSVPEPIRAQLSQYLIQYVIEYRAENESLFYGKDFEAILQNFEYMSYVMSASRVPNEIFFQAKKIFKQLTPDRQRELRPKLNELIRAWTRYPNEKKHIKTNRL